MSFAHRIPALWTSALATSAIAFCTLAGTSCDFVEVTAKPGSLLLSADEVELMAVAAGVGVLCENEFYSSDDQMLMLSRLFLYLSLGLGGAAVILAWAVTTVVPPTNFNWKLLSLLSSVVAVIQVPIFLIFESIPCSEFPEVQYCNLSTGSFFLMASTVVWIVVTLCTQCLDPPLWAAELREWKSNDELKRDDFDINNYRITRIERQIVPDAIVQTKPTKKARAGKGWFFGRPRENDDLLLAANPTESMNDDDFGGPLPMLDDNSLNNRVVLRLDGRQSRDPVSSDIGNVLKAAEEGWLDDSMTKQVQSSYARNNPPKTFIQASSPSKATERIQIVSNSELQTRKGKSPIRKKSSSSREDNMASPNTARTSPMNTSAILADLGVSAQGYAPSKVEENKNHENAKKNDNYTNGLRALTKKIKSDSNRRRSRMPFQRRGYQQMFDDDSSYDEPFMSPPIEVKIQPFANFENAEFTDDEKEDLMDDWNELHKATTAGVRMGMQEGFGDDDKIDFDAPMDGYHSDPEPAYYASDDSKSNLSRNNRNKKEPLASRVEDDNSTLSSGAKSLDGGKSQKVKVRRRRRHASSPNASLASGSLMALTIDEETVQDILEESSLGEVDPELAAISNQGKIEQASSSKVDDPAQSSTEKQTRQEEEKKEDPPEQFSTLNTNAKRSYSVAAAARVKRQFRTRSLSPIRRGPRVRPQTLRSDIASLGGMHARAEAMDDDSSDEPSKKSRSNMSQRAREFRIKRMQRMKGEDEPLQDGVVPVENQTQASSHELPQNRTLQGDEKSQGGDSYLEDRQNAYNVSAKDSMDKMENGADEISKFSVGEDMSKFTLATAKSDLPLDFDAIMDSLAEESPTPETVPETDEQQKTEKTIEESVTRLDSGISEPSDSDLPVQASDDRRALLQPTTPERSTKHRSEPALGISSDSPLGTKAVTFDRNSSEFGVETLQTTDLSANKDAIIRSLAQADTPERTREIIRTIAEATSPKRTRNFEMKTDDLFGSGAGGQRLYDASKYNNEAEKADIVADDDISKSSIDGRPDEMVPKSSELHDDTNLFGGSLLESHDARLNANDLLDDEDDLNYDNYVMDNLDLQLIEIRRPIGKEYGDDEASL